MLIMPICFYHSLNKTVYVFGNHYKLNLWQVQGSVLDVSLKVFLTKVHSVSFVTLYLLYYLVISWTPCILRCIFDTPSFANSRCSHLQMIDVIKPKGISLHYIYLKISLYDWGRARDRLKMSSRCLSCESSIASSEASSPEIAILCSLLQISVTSLFFTVI
jgi:hypothetical protein